MVRLPPGSKVDRFEIKSLIGSGGMGTLYLARDTSPTTYRLVALKVLNTNLDTDDLRDRFTREARALASLNHPNVVHIHETGDFRGSPYIVMEYVSGETVAEKIRRKAPLALVDKLKLMMDLCGGLAHAHDAAILHRDIKPANLMVDHNGRLRLLDFGIARVSTGMTIDGASMTQLNMRIGTPGYMSPEQYEGAEIDRRSDIFAVGTVFYELLAFREPFPGATTRQIEKSVLQSEPERLTSRIAGLDPEIAALVSRALEKNPDKRFQDAGEMERALGKVWWRLGFAESAQSVRRAAPSPGEGRKTSRAEAAYQRAKSALEQGAPEAARRYALEAVAEDSNHREARRLLQQNDPEFRLPAPPPAPPHQEEPLMEATIVSSRSELLPAGGSDQTIVSSPARRPPPPKRAAAAPVGRERGAAAAKRKRAWRWPAALSPRRVAVAAATIGLVSASAVLVAMVIRNWTPASDGDGLPLTVIKPLNGTIVGAGIECGTRGATCTVSLAPGAMVELTLRPDDGFVAASFTNDCAQGGQFRMSSARTCGATFERSVPSGRGSEKPPSTEQRTLTVFPGEGGQVFVGDLKCQGVRQCLWTFPIGQEVDLEAKADGGYVFQRFAGSGCDRDGIAVMSDHRTCEATFERAAQALGGTSPTPSQISKTKPTGTGSRGGANTSGGGDKTGPGSKNASGGGGTPPEPPIPAGGSGGAGTSQNTSPGTPGIPQPPPPPPTKSDEELAKEEITAVLERYRRAYEAFSLEDMRAVYPTVDPRVVEQSKRLLAKVKLSFSGPPKIDLNLSENTAGAEVAMSRIELKRGQVKEEQSAVKALRAILHRRTGNNSWVIEKLSFVQ